MSEDTSNSGSSGGDHGGSAAEIDVEQLAERVYRLMQADLRLGRARGEPGSRSVRGHGRRMGAAC